MPSFLSFLLFSVVCVSVVSADLIPASKDPCNLNADLALQVDYPEDELAESHENSTAEPQCGTKRDLEAVRGRDAPEVIIVQKTGIKADSLSSGKQHIDQESFFFTLVMVDPDAPTESGNPMYYLHWLIVDNEGDDFTSEHGVEIKSYAPPSPPAGSGPHRYQFFAYRQLRGKFTDSTLYGNPESGRSNFDLKYFQTKNNLGAPTVGYQFLTEKTGKERKDNGSPK